MLTSCMQPSSFRFWCFCICASDRSAALAHKNQIPTTVTVELSKHRSHEVLSPADLQPNIPSKVVSEQLESLSKGGLCPHVGGSFGYGKFPTGPVGPRSAESAEIAVHKKMTRSRCLLML